MVQRAVFGHFHIQNSALPIILEERTKSFEFVANEFITLDSFSAPSDGVYFIKFNAYGIMQTAGHIDVALDTEGKHLSVDHYERNGTGYFGLNVFNIIHLKKNESVWISFHSTISENSNDKASIFKVVRLSNYDMHLPEKIK